MRDLSPITALVLAGGLGTRLRSAVPNLPKVLAPVRGRPFLAFLLDRLAEAGIRQAVLGTGYMAEAVADKFGDRHGLLRLCYSRETAPLGTGGAVRLALPLLESDPVLVLNGDSYFDADLPAFVDAFAASRGRAALLRTRVADVSRYGQVHAAEDGRVLRFEEKGAAAGPGWINTGIYLFRREVLAAVPPGHAVSLEKEVFPALVGGGLYAFAQPCRFLDIGTPQSYRGAASFFARRGARSSRRARHSSTSS